MDAKLRQSFMVKPAEKIKEVLGLFLIQGLHISCENHLEGKAKVPGLDLLGASKTNWKICHGVDSTRVQYLYSCCDM
jgi:hypothetical protein